MAVAEILLEVESHDTRAIKQRILPVFPVDPVTQTLDVVSWMVYGDLGHKYPLSEIRQSAEQYREARVWYLLPGLLAREIHESHNPLRPASLQVSEPIISTQSTDPSPLLNRLKRPFQAAAAKFQSVKIFPRGNRKMIKSGGAIFRGMD